MTSVSVIIPVFNNASTLQELFDRICAALDSVTDDYEVIFINDGSADESWKIIRSMTEDNSRCVGLQLSRNFGQHPAIHAGLDRASGDLTVLMDADLQDRPEELPRILAPFDSDDELDIVYTRFELEAGAKSRLTSRLFSRVLTRITGNEMPRNVGTYRVFTRQVREALLDYSESSAVYGPLMVQMGYQHSFVDVARSAAVGRTTSYTFGKRLTLAISALISYSAFLHWVVTLTGLVMTSLSGLFLVVITIQYASGFRVLVNGQLLLLGVTVLLSGVLLMSIGVLTAYTTRIFQEVLDRPKYHVARQAGTGLERKASQ